MKTAQKVHVKSKIWLKIFVKHTREKIDTHEKFNKIYPWKGILSLKFAPVKPNFQLVKKMKKSAHEKKMDVKKSKNCRRET